MPWEPVVILPNLTGGFPLDGGVIAIVSSDDPRLTEICLATPYLENLLSRFTDAFGKSVKSSVMIIREDMVTRLHTDAYISFRDVAATSVITYGRAENIIYRSTNSAYYSNSFAFYPWMVSRDRRSLIARTPAFSGFHVVEEFSGQSSPELPSVTLNRVDPALFAALLALWTQYYVFNRKSWRARALFRSLNMAMAAAAMPGGVDASAQTIFDIGRSVSLWVSHSRFSPIHGPAKLAFIPSSIS